MAVTPLGFDSSLSITLPWLIRFNNSSEIDTSVTKTEFDSAVSKAVLSFSRRENDSSELNLTVLVTALILTRWCSGQLWTRYDNDNDSFELDSAVSIPVLSLTQRCPWQPEFYWAMLIILWAWLGNVNGSSELGSAMPKNVLLSNSALSLKICNNNLERLRNIYGIFFKKESGKKSSDAFCLSVYIWIC